MNRLACVIAAVFCLVISGPASANILADAPGEIRLDPASVSVEPKTYQEDDVLAVFTVFGPPIATVDLASVSIRGFALPDGRLADLRQSLFMEAKFDWKHPFGAAAWSAVPIVPGARIFCSQSMQNVGPFEDAPPKWKTFAARTCLVDNAGEGKFDMIMLIAKNESRVVGPAPINPVAYTINTGENERQKRIEFYLEDVYWWGVLVGLQTYRDGKKYHESDLFIMEDSGYMMNYSGIGVSPNCQMVFRKDRDIHVMKFAYAQFEVSKFDKKNVTIEARFLGATPAVPAVIGLTSQWAPSLGSGCRYEE